MPGKSTLFNRLTGAKVSIVTPKAQTTRARVLGILVRGEAQILFVDTPGIFAPKRRLDRAMVAAAWDGAGEADYVLLLVDAKTGLTEAVRDIIAQAAATGRKMALVLNKVDLLDRQKLLPLTQDDHRAREFRAGVHDLRRHRRRDRGVAGFLHRQAARGAVSIP